MFKYNLNLKNGSAKARMCMFGFVTSLTLTLGFASQAAAMENDLGNAVGSLRRGTILADGSAEMLHKKYVNGDVKPAAGTEESLARAEKKAEELNAAREAEETEQEASEAQATQPAAAYGGSDYEKELLASIIFCEAGNQSFLGQVAVGAVVMNRMASGSYPDTMEEVIYQPGQFSPAGSGWLDQVRSTRGYTESAMQAAEAALAGENPVAGCLYFDQGGYGMQIGAHYFH